MDKKAIIHKYNESKYIEESIAPVQDYRVINPSNSKPYLTGLMGVNSFGTANSLEANHYMKDMVRSFIPLCMPIINPILTKPIITKIASILGLSKSIIEEIMSGNIIYDKKDEQLIKLHNAINNREYLYNGEILEHYIEKLEIPNRIITVLKSILISKFYTEKEAKGNPLLVKEDKDNPNIIHGYSVEILFSPKKSKNLCVKDLWDYLHKEYLIKYPESALSILMRIDKNNLYCLTLRNIRVVPIGIRPSKGRRHDPLNTLYAAIIMSNNVLKSIRPTNNPLEIARKVAKLQEAVNECIYETTAHNKEKQRKSISELLGGKYGRIRKNGLAKVQDFTGRSVIVANPNLKLDEISIPKEILKSIMYYHTNLNPEAYNSLEEAVSDVPILLNRAPTLHRLSYLGYKAVISNDNSIGIHPLNASGYNADHDGDTMAVKCPLSKEVMKEINILMLSSMNMYIPANGSFTLLPKQELIYGLNIISSSYSNPSTAPVKAVEDILSVFENAELRVYDRVNYKGVIKTLGEHIAEYCFPFPVKNLTKKNIESVMSQLAYEDINRFKMYVDRIVHCAYVAATLYSPTISILKDMSDTYIENPFKDFENKMSKYREAYQDGFDNKEHYYQIYSEEYASIVKQVKEHLCDDVGEDNGFVKLVKCGARGDESNLQQMFSYKGRIAKSATESFPAVITSSYIQQLTSLEQFICAYGTRKAVIDKVRKPADTGDAMRRMMHTTIDAVIVTDDCGTENGITITLDKLRQFCEPRGLNEIEMRNMFAAIIKGRYEAKTNIFITKDMANEIADRANPEITIRSILTCENPYCTKCYGVDLTSRRRAIKGLPIGAIAAQSIGEPGTQLTMRTFHKGGVVSKADITSDFDKVNNIIELTRITEDNSLYDPVAWATGDIVKVGQQVFIKDDTKYWNTRSVVVNPKADLKEKVNAGEGLCKSQGNLNIEDIYKYAGIKKAQEYIVFSIFTIYFAQAEVNIKHLEILASEMTKYIIVDHKKPDLPIPIGTILDCRELYKLDKKDCYIIIPRLYSCTYAPIQGNSFLSALSFQRINETLANATLLNKEDNMEKAYSCIMAGYAPESGAKYPNFLEEREALMKEKPYEW